MCKVSILMPAYNAEQYISDAVVSIINQTFADWELVIVDDCSTDSTGKICDDFSYIDNRIKVFHMPSNFGISEAKNQALYKASGEYIAFCDDDDIMEKAALLDNMKLAEKYNPQIVRWSYKTVNVDENGCVTRIIDRKCEDGIYLKRGDIFSNYRNIHSMLSCDWTALYKRSFLNDNNILFNTKFRYGGEDTEFNINALRYAEKIVMNSNSYYNWYLRKGHSTTSRRNVNFCYSMIEVARKEHDLIMHNCIDYKTIWMEYNEFYKKLILDYACNLKLEEKKSINSLLEGDNWYCLNCNDGGIQSV